MMNDARWVEVCQREQSNAYSQSYMLHAKRYRDLWSTRTIQACHFAMIDLHSTLKEWPWQSEYTGKLWAEVDAIRDRQAAIQKGR